jgi:formamidopyrimidine-DNA glycosylase
MPELPELERARRLADDVAVGRTIRRVKVHRDEIVYEGVSPQRVRRALSGRTIVAAHRHGKQLWLELDRRPWPLFHFGMSGGFHTPVDDDLQLTAGPKVDDDAWPPRFAKLHLHFDDGGELVMTNARRLGRIRLRKDPASEPPVSELGFDPLLELPTPARFRALVSERTGTLKGLLLDQAFAAGVGNWIADEVLYQAGLDPRRRANTLDAGEIERMRRKLGSVVRAAVRVNADKRRFPRTWLFHRRWGKDAGAETVEGHPIVHVTLGGRTTAWVPARQS